MSERPRRGKLSKESIQKALRIFRYVKPYRLLFSVGLLFLFLSSSASLVMPKLLGELINSASEGEIANQIDKIGLILVAVLILQAVFSFFRIVIFVNVTEKVLASLRQATYTHLIKLPMSFFSEKRVGELNSRISSDITLLQETFTTTLAEFIRQLITIVGGIAILSYTSWKLTLFMLSLVPVLAIVAVIFGKFIRRYSKKVQNEIAESNTIVEETLQGIFNVKAFVNEFLEIKRYTNKTNEVAKTAIKGGKYRGAFASFIILGMFGAIVAVIWYSIKIEVRFGDLTTVLFMSAFIGGSIGGLADVYAKIQKAIGATENLMEILDEETEDVLDSEKVNTNKLQGNLSLIDINFNYPSRKEIQVLKNITLDIKQGEQIALVGPSGSGKSTLVSLILNFYKPDAGYISFDGKKADSFNLTELRSNMAVVPQDVLLFGGTIRENIAYGKPNATEEEIIEAAKKANAHRFIIEFPESYETIVGERGIQLSGGQRQRVAIARATIKDPSILILDEATSALDSESERLVQEALDKLMKGRTSIVIAHRLSTIRDANKIVVLDRGEIVETGTHEELSSKEGGIYKNLSSLQFAG